MGRTRARARASGAKNNASPHIGARALSPCSRGPEASRRDAQPLRTRVCEIRCSVRRSISAQRGLELVSSHEHQRSLIDRVMRRFATGLVRVPQTASQRGSLLARASGALLPSAHVVVRRGLARKSAAEKDLVVKESSSEVSVRYVAGDVGSDVHVHAQDVRRAHQESSHGRGCGRRARRPRGHAQAGASHRQVAVQPSAGRVGHQGRFRTGAPRL